MTHAILALVGAAIYILGYAFYTLAGTFTMPGSDAVVSLLEFGSVIATVVLAALVMGATLSRPTGDSEPKAPDSKER